MLGTVFIESGIWGIAKKLLGSLPGMWFQVLELTIWGPEPGFALRGTQRYEEALFNVSRHMAGCQNHGPVLAPTLVLPLSRKTNNSQASMQMMCWKATFRARCRGISPPLSALTTSKFRSHSEQTRMHPYCRPPVVVWGLRLRGSPIPAPSPHGRGKGVHDCEAAPNGALALLGRDNLNRKF